MCLSYVRMPAYNTYIAHTSGDKGSETKVRQTSVDTKDKAA